MNLFIFFNLPFLRTTLSDSWTKIKIQQKKKTSRWIVVHKKRLPLLKLIKMAKGETAHDAKACMASVKHTGASVIIYVSLFATNSMIFTDISLLLQTTGWGMREHPVNQDTDKSTRSTKTQLIHKLSKSGCLLCYCIHSEFYSKRALYHWLIVSLIDWTQAFFEIVYVNKL